MGEPGTGKGNSKLVMGSLKPGQTGKLNGQGKPENQVKPGSKMRQREGKPGSLQ